MAGGKIRIAAHVEVEWLEETGAARCPNCGGDGLARRLLEIDYRPPDAAHRFVLQVCPVCTARFADNPETMDYGSHELIEIGWHTYQIQLGAGIWPITAPLTRIEKPAGARMLEIGGAYGFGLDFGIRGLGWAGVGYDPSPLAAFGRRELGLDVRQRYFAAAELTEGGYDVVLATEVVEHLAAPPEFLALMRRAVADEGVLLLTTPDAEWITPDLPAAALMPLLSPGAHVVLQTATSLELALRNAGFTHVRVRREAMSLVAYASPAPFTLRDDAAAGRALFRRYLVERAAQAELASDLRLGFAGRGLFEAANDGDGTAAKAAWEVLAPAVLARFGLDLETLDGLPPAAAGAGLAALGGVMPLGLGMILFGRAMQRLAAGESRGELLALFRLAVAAIDALQAALAQRSLRDGLSAALRQVAEVEVLLCQADAGAAAAVAGLRALTDDPVRRVAGWRALVGLVNAGAFAPAAELRAALRLDEPADLPADLRRDALLSLANLALAPGGEVTPAFVAGVALEAMAESADEIMLQAFTRLVNAGRYEEALAAFTTHGIAARAAKRAGGAASDDARLARMILDLAVGDPAALPGRLEGLTLPAERRAVLLLEAFVRLVNAARYQEAAGFLTAHGVAALAAQLAEGALREDAVMAVLLLELNLGDAAAVAARLPAVALRPENRRALLLEAFVRLVNGSRYDEAAVMLAAHDVAALAAAAGGGAGQSAGLALTVMDLAVGDPLAVPARLAGLAVPPAQRETLLLEAYIRLVNGSRFGDAAVFKTNHDVPALAARAAGAAGVNAAIALAVAELGDGDPALVPSWLALCPVPPERAEALLLGAFTGLVNAGRAAAAQALAEAHGLFGALATAVGAAAADARLAAVLLDLDQGRTEAAVARILALRVPARDQPAVDRLYVDGFVRLVNEGRFEAARRLNADEAVAARLAQCGPPLRADGLAALLLLALQPGGDPAEIRARLGAAVAGLPEARATALALAAFVTLVNAAELREARRLLPMVEPALLALRPPYEPAGRDALFAAGVLALQDGDGTRRAAALFARLRDALVKLAPPGTPDAPDPLFWPTLRGEIIALGRLDRGAEASALLASFLPVYGGAPDDLREQAA